MGNDDIMTTYDNMIFSGLMFFPTSSWPCPMALRQVVQELLKPLSDKKAPDRARLGALTCLALLAEQREGAGNREVVKGRAQYLKFWEAAIIRTY